MASEILAAASEADIVIVGKSDRAYPQRVKLGETARTLSARSPSAVLIAHYRFVAAAYSPPGAILVAYDDTPTGDRALRLAARLALSERHPITVLIPDSKRTAPRLEEEADALLAAFGLQPRFRRLGRREAARLRRSYTRNTANCSFSAARVRCFGASPRTMSWKVWKSRCS